MNDSYEIWIDQVRAALDSKNMPIDQWQSRWSFDFRREHVAGIDPRLAAMKANRFWWREQNKAIGQDCRRTPGCWLPTDHQGECQPIQ